MRHTKKKLKSCVKIRDDSDILEHNKIELIENFYISITDEPKAIKSLMD